MYNAGSDSTRLAWFSANGYNIVFNTTYQPNTSISLAGDDRKVRRHDARHRHPPTVEEMIGRSA